MKNVILFHVAKIYHLLLDVLNSDIWVEKISNSQYYDLIFSSLIPTMTSNSDLTNNTICSITSTGVFTGGQELYKAFNGILTSDNSDTLGSEGTEKTIIVHFKNPRFISKIKTNGWMRADNNDSTTKTIKFETSTDGVKYEEIKSISHSYIPYGVEETVSVNKENVNYIRYTLTADSSKPYCYIKETWIYGR